MSPIAPGGVFPSALPNTTSTRSRRSFIKAQVLGLAGAALAANPARSQIAGDRPKSAAGVKVMLPRARVPVGLIIDDSTCLVNTNKFAMPQFDEAFGHASRTYQRNWREWPNEIPDAFVRKFGEWCADKGVKGKYSIVPYPACVGRLDRILPGWSQRDLSDSLELVRSVLLPNWDIHPEMITHTRVIDLKTGHPYEDQSLKFMENWEWTTGRSADEIGEYMAYALRILKNVGLPCEGITTPGGFGNKALPQLAQASLASVRDVFGAEVPHYFRHLYASGPESVAPRVEYASGLDGPDPRCVVSIIGCTGDWTGGWDNSPPEGVDRFISADLQTGRMIEVIQREEPAMMLAHWTGIYWNGQELGFTIFKEVVQRLQSRFNHLIWMKLSEVARYWAAKELTQIQPNAGSVHLRAPFACPLFTLKCPSPRGAAPRFRIGPEAMALQEVPDRLRLVQQSWCREGDSLIACIPLPKGPSTLELK